MNGSPMPVVIKGHTRSPFHIEWVPSVHPVLAITLQESITYPLSFSVAILSSLVKCTGSLASHIVISPCCKRDLFRGTVTVHCTANREKHNIFTLCATKSFANLAQNNTVKSTWHSRILGQVGYFS